MTSIDDCGLNLRPDVDRIMAAIKAVHPDGGLFEVRVPKVKSGNPLRWYGHTFNGVYDAGNPESLEAAVRDVARIDGHTAAGVYMTVNALDPIVRNYGLNRLQRSDKAVADAEVIRLKYLYLDFDPIRPSLTNATEGERNAAIERLRAVYAHLRSEGWPDPVIAGSSGSGAMGLWPINLPPTESGLVENALKGLAARFDDDAVRVDTSVGNPARIVRMPGTINAKSPTPQSDRPWTMATAKVVTV